MGGFTVVADLWGSVSGIEFLSNCACFAFGVLECFVYLAGGTCVILVNVCLVWLIWRIRCRYLELCTGKS